MAVLNAQFLPVAISYLGVLLKFRNNWRTGAAPYSHPHFSALLRRFRISYPCATDSALIGAVAQLKSELPHILKCNEGVFSR